MGSRHEAGNGGPDDGLYRDAIGRLEALEVVAETAQQMLGLAHDLNLMHPIVRELDAALAELEVNAIGGRTAYIRSATMMEMWHDVARETGLDLRTEGKRAWMLVRALRRTGAAVLPVSKSTDIVLIHAPGEQGTAI